MSVARQLTRQPPPRAAILRRFCTAPSATSESPAVSNRYLQHEFLSPSSYINSWTPPRNPGEANAQLALRRRDYDRKVKQIRKEYIKEMELRRIEKSRKDEASKEALRIANEQRKAAKDAKKKAEAIERQAAEQEFRELLMKERAEKLEYWRMREKQIEERKKAKSELLLRKSSQWIAESDLTRAALVAMVDSKAHLDNFRLND